MLWVLVQVVAQDPFPPEISLSQYGLGGAGWLFSVWVVVLASSPLLLLRYRPVPGPARWLLAIGYAGTVGDGARPHRRGCASRCRRTPRCTWAARWSALVFLPLGILCALRYRGPTMAAGGPWPDRHLGTAVVVGVLVLLSAAGVDTAGLGAARSWALWQGALVVIEMVLVAPVRGGGLDDRPEVAVVPVGSAPVKSAIQ